MFWPFSGIKTIHENYQNITPIIVGAILGAAVTMLAVFVAYKIFQYKTKTIPKGTFKTFWYMFLLLLLSKRYNSYRALHIKKAVPNLISDKQIIKLPLKWLFYVTCFSVNPLHTGM